MTAVVDKRMMLDNDCIFFSQVLIKFIYIQTIYRIITAQFTVAPEGRCKQQDLFLLKLRIFLINSLVTFSLYA